MFVSIKNHLAVCTVVELIEPKQLANPQVFQDLSIIYSSTGEESVLISMENFVKVFGLRIAIDPVFLWLKAGNCVFINSPKYGTYEIAAFADRQEAHNHHYG